MPAESEPSRPGGPVPPGEVPARGAEVALASDATLAQITNAIVALTREHLGRGPVVAKSYVLDDLVVCVMRDGLTTAERTMIEAGERDRAQEIRSHFQRLMESRYRDIVERRTGRRVVACLSQSNIEPHLTVDVFVLGEPTSGS